jgi:hypothetical protein
MEGIRKESKNFLGSNENENTTYQTSEIEQRQC